MFLLSRSGKSHGHTARLPQSGRIENGFGIVALLDDDDFKTALPALLLAEKTYPKDAGIQALLGKTLAGTGDKTGAEKAYRKALVLLPDDDGGGYFARIGRRRSSAA